MAKNVFILGAGASREAGAPLMFDFLDSAEKIFLFDLARETEYKEAFTVNLIALHLPGCAARLQS